MRALREMFDEYDVSHRDDFNKRMHWICVPLIVFSLLGLLWSVETPRLFGDARLLNWAVLTVVAAQIYYALLSPRLALGVFAVAGAMLGLIAWMAAMRVPLTLVCAILFVFAWAGQFVGHHVEGRRPSFFTDLRFLLIGPLWLLAFVYRRLGIRY
jgi:uncharacterized membrane protein YGL010W